MLIIILTNTNFNLDINECETNNHDCDINATCDNTFGSFTCTCNIGYEGDGEVCVGKNNFFLSRMYFNKFILEFLSFELIFNFN